MTTRPLLTYWISYTAATVAIAVIMPFVSRSRRAHADVSGFDEQGNFRRGTMRMPTSTLVIGAVCFLLSWGMAVLSFVHPDSDEQSPLISLGLVGLSFPGAVLLKQYFLDHVYLDPRTLTYRGVRTRTMSWDEIVSVRYSQPAQWFRIEAQDGQVIRVSTMLNGLQDFAHTVLAKVPAERIDTRARTLLKKSQHGELPVVRR